jgi:hypothetical protein
LKKAQNCMERTLTKTGGNDGPSQFYLEQIARLEASGLPSEWSGVVTLTDK